MGVFQLKRSLPSLYFGSGLIGTRLVRLAIHPPDLAALRLGVDVVGIARIGEHPEAVAAVEVFPAAAGDAARIRRVADPRAVVLQAAVDVVRAIHVDAHVVELRDRQVVGLPPAIAAVVRIPEAAVVAGDEVVGVVGIDPDVVPVAVAAAADAAEALAAVVRWRSRPPPGL